MRNIFFLLLLSVAISCKAQSLTSPKENRDATAPLGYKKVAEALLSLQSKPNAQIAKTQPDGWTIITFPQPEFALWSFTPEGHYAHPAVVRRTLKQENGMVYAGTSAICENTKQACDNLMREFDALTNQVRKELYRPMSASKQD